MGIKKNVKRYDLGELRSAERTPQGFLKAPGFATRTGVFPYIDGDGQVRRELRHPDDVFDPESMKTLQYAPVTIEHPPVMLDPKNVAAYSKGHTTERVEVNREMVDVDLIIEHQDAIDAVEKEGIRELSSGYMADIVEEEGTYNGAPYNFRQKNIRYNHLALVRRGRAGPEVRLRLDSSDAIMRTDDVSVPTNSEFSQESSVNDSEEGTKSIVVLGKEIALPPDIADAIQEMLDRYDEMRAKLSEVEEEMSKKRTDVDVSQPGVSPQVKVEQMGPDGKKAPSKVAAGASTVHPDAEEEEKEDGDEHGVIGGVAKVGKADDEHEDEDEKEEKEKKDYEAAPAGAGGGAAKSFPDQIKDMKMDMDKMQAKLDEYAAASMNQGEAKPDRMDSKDIKATVRARVKLERQAEKMVPFEVAKKFDSMTDDQIRKSVIKHKHPKADLDGKSATYLESRFDSIIESNEDDMVSERSHIGRKMLGIGEDGRMDSGEASDPRSARQKSIKESQELWKKPLSASKQ